MPKKRTMDELRQTKDTHYVNPTFQGGDFIKPTEKPAKSTAEVMSKSPFEHEEVDKTVDQIVEDLEPQIFDAIFQMINDEMAKRYVFDSSEYLTEAGLELFEDEWFEFYHENHGKIMYKLLQNLK
jgi:hypothetical protein